MNIEKFIKNKEILIKKKLNNPHHVALCFDRNYAMPAGILITSILANNKHLNFSFHLFALSIDDDDKNRFQAMQGKAEITLYNIDNSFNDIGYANKNGLLPISTNIRLIVPPLLKDKAASLLYLDCDMLCTGKLDKLLNTDISNHIAACVLDVNEFRNKYPKKIGLPNNNYFNAGMLYINTEKWYAENITEKTLSLLAKNSYEYLDQDVLNLTLNDKFIQVDDVFNYLTQAVTKHRVNLYGKTKPFTKIVLFHFITPSKPWFKLYLLSVYKKYIDKSLWRDKQLKLVHASNPSVIRVVSKELMKDNYYLEALKLKALYFLNKLHLINSLK